MIYSDKDIMDALDVGTFTIDPRPARDDISPSAVDLRLHNIFTVFDSEDKLEVADTERVVQRYGDTVDIPVGDYLELKPGAFALGYTREHVDLPMNLAARVEGKSSLAGWVFPFIRLHQPYMRISTATSGWRLPTLARLRVG
ncbi:dCTP deaminase, dUMP-forming [Geodia barretti]|uniref:dCTP deaminase, dUMP-forming n=1 Tax=Geodia barretti TaxID=519541 RepID=A0AA35SKE6_GEOBA|nr:dCTP deaminase, dUMP-forming [Geodia barretti]